MSDRNKAQLEVQRTSTDLEKAKATEVRAQAEVFRTQAVQEEARAQRESVTRERDSIIAEMRVTDHDDLATLQRLGIERSTLDAQLVALDGAAERARGEHSKAQGDLDIARAAVARAEEAQKSAQEKYQRAEEAHREVELVAAGDPGALREKAAREKREAVLNEHLRIVRSHGVFGPGAGPCEASIEAAQIHTRLSTREPLDANEVGWGYGSAGAGRNTSPVGARGGAPEQMQEGSKPYNTHDPLRNE